MYEIGFRHLSYIWNLILWVYSNICKGRRGGGEMFLKKLAFVDTDTRLSREKFITIQFFRGLREMEKKIKSFIPWYWLSSIFTKKITPVKNKQTCFLVIIKVVPEAENPLIWKLNNTDLKSASQTYLGMTRQSTLGFRKTKNMAKGTLEEVILEVLQADQNHFWFVYTCPVKHLLPFELPKITSLAVLASSAMIYYLQL